MADVESLELKIQGNARGAKKSLDALIATLEKLDKVTAGGCGLGAVSKEMGKMQNISIGLSSANRTSAASFGKLATKVVGAALAMKKVSSTIASWINESNEYVENLNLFSVAMGEYAEAAQEYGEKVGEIMGIDPSTWMRNQGVFMTMTTGFGVAGDRAATMSQQLTQLGYDLSSFYNISVEDAMQKLQSGIAGELEPLRRLGYDLSQAKLEATALKLGIDKTVSSMTQAEKAELRYYAIMTQVTQAQGDMARTLDAPANQLRIFKAQTEQAARALGNIFIPALNAILPYAIAAVKVIRILADAIASLVGFTLPEMDYSDLGNTGNDIADGFEDANKEAAKLKRMLLGIDELNVLSDSGSGSGNDLGGGGFDFDLPTYDFIGEATSNRVNQIVENMKEWLGITGDIDSWSDLFDTRLGNILKTVGLIGVGIAAWKVTKGFMTSIELVTALLKSKSYSITIGATVAIMGFSLAFGGMDDALSRGLEGFNFAEILAGGLMGTGGAALLGSTLATWIDTAFAGSAIDLAITQAGINLGVGTAGAAGAAILGSFAAVILGIPTFFVGIYDAIKNGIDWLSGILIPAGATAAGAGIGAIIGMLGGPIGAGIGALIGLAVGLVTDLIFIIVENWSEITNWCTNACATIGGFFGDLWEGISDAASTCWSAIVDYFSPAIEWFSKLFGSVWQTISDIFYNIGVIAGGCWEVIKVVWAAVSGWFDTNVVQPVAEFFSGLWDGFVEKASAAWEGVKKVFSVVGNFFRETFEEAWSGIVEVFSVAGEIFVDIKDGILAAFKTVVNGLIKGINKVIAVPFKGINNALNEIKKIEIVGIKPFAGLMTISIPEIPQLADGGIVGSGQMFVAREAGPELVGTVGNRTAVVNNDQIVESVSQGVYRAVVQAMAQSGNQTVEAKVNDKVLFEVIVNRNRQETMRTGYSPLLGGA